MYIFNKTLQRGAGPNGLVEEGTEIGNQLLVGVTNNPENAFKLGETCIKEAKALGGNMALKSQNGGYYGSKIFKRFIR